jgi:hypothetical protein
MNECLQMCIFTFEYLLYIIYGHAVNNAKLCQRVDIMSHAQATLVSAKYKFVMCIVVKDSPRIVKSNQYKRRKKS